MVRVHNQDSSDRPSFGERTQGRLLRSQEDIDLAKAYAIRAQREKAEQMEIERLKQDAARQRWEAKTRFEALVKDKVLNHPEADIARYFSYGGKIKRIYVTADQLKALNAGELGVVQLKGRYLLVTAELLAQVEGGVCACDCIENRSECAGTGRFLCRSEIPSA